MREKIQKLIKQLRATDDPEEQDLIKKEIDLIEDEECTKVNKKLI